MLYFAAAIGGVGAGAVYGTCVGNALQMVPGPARPGGGPDRGGLRRRFGADHLPYPAMIKASGYEATFFYFGMVQGVVILIGCPDSACAAPPGEGPRRDTAVQQTARDSRRSRC